jgi:GT2 family glycosyltransferase
MTIWNLFCRASGLATAFPSSGLLNTESYGGWRRDTEREVDIVSGCFLLICRDRWEKLGGFDPAFFMYGEEADLCLRAGKGGLRPRTSPNATIVHIGGASETVRADKVARLLAAKSKLIRRHWSPILRPVGLALLAAWPLSRSMAGRIMSGGARRSESTRAWSEVWARRREWLGEEASA